MSNDLLLLQCFTKRINLEYIYSNSLTILNMAVCKNKLEIVDFCLEKNALINNLKTNFNNIQQLLIKYYTYRNNMYIDILKKYLDKYELKYQMNCYRLEQYIIYGEVEKLVNLLNKTSFNKDEVTSYNVEVIASSPHIEITKILYNYGFSISGNEF